MCDLIIQAICHVVTYAIYVAISIYAMVVGHSSSTTNYATNDVVHVSASHSSTIDADASWHAKSN